MIERKFIAQKIKEKQIQDLITKKLGNAGQSRIAIKRTPLGDKVIVYTSRPGLVVGRKGENIKALTRALKNKFQMENPQIEVGEIENPFLDANSMAEKVVYSLTRFGPKRFKFIGYSSLRKIMDAGAIGAEIIIGGVGVPGARARSWRFSSGYLKKSGDVLESQVRRAGCVAKLKRGAIGVKVNIMPPDIKLPDKIVIKEIEKEVKIEEVAEEPKTETEEIIVQEEEKVEKKKPAKKVKEKVKKTENGDNKEK